MSMPEKKKAKWFSRDILVSSLVSGLIGVLIPSVFSGTVSLGVNLWKFFVDLPYGIASSYTPYSIPIIIVSLFGGYFIGPSIGFCYLILKEIINLKKAESVVASNREEKSVFMELVFPFLFLLYCLIYLGYLVIYPAAIKSNFVVKLDRALICVDAADLNPIRAKWTLMDSREDYLKLKAELAKLIEENR
ncbi:MAG: hypothetical protein E7037_05230 [Verrucomicrobia bacterium]|nr:hypothetical protein [Verrucomicrobiota bacterium]